MQAAGAGSGRHASLGTVLEARARGISGRMGLRHRTFGLLALSLLADAGKERYGVSAGACSSSCAGAAARVIFDGPSDGFRGGGRRLVVGLLRRTEEDPTTAQQMPIIAPLWAHF